MSTPVPSEFPNAEAAVPADPTDHVIHMWEPLSFTVPENYDYARAGFWKSVWTFLLRTAVVHLVTLYNYLFLGFRLHGAENIRALGSSGAVTVCNHVHPLDCVMQTTALYPHRTYTLTLESNFRIPIVCHLIHWLDAVPLPTVPHRLGEMLRTMGSAAKAGNFVHVYPEAILLPYCDHLRKFQPGAFRIAAEEHLPVLPMVICPVKPHGIYKIFKHKPCLEMTVLPPISCPERGSVRKRAQALSDLCFERMDACLKGEHSHDSV